MNKENQELGSPDVFALMAVWAMAAVFLGLPLGIAVNDLFFEVGSGWGQLVLFTTPCIAVALAYRHFKKNPSRVPMLW